MSNQWQPCGDTGSNAASDPGHHPPGTLWYAEDETVGAYSSVLASHRQPDRRYLQRMCVLCQTSEQTTEASKPPLDAAREAMEPYPR